MTALISLKRFNYQTIQNDKDVQDELITAMLQAAHRRYGESIGRARKRMIKWLQRMDPLNLKHVARQIDWNDEQSVIQNYYNYLPGRVVAQVEILLERMMFAP